MRTIALETTERAGSVAAFLDDKLLAELELDPDRRSAQSLAPALVELCRQLGWKPTGIDLAAVAVGPGSFTGLRVGVTTAKLLAYAAQGAILGVDTLEVIASRAPAEVQAVSAAVDAQRGQVVAQAFRRDAAGLLVPAGEQQLVDIDRWFAGLEPDALLTGPVLRKLAAQIPGHLRALDPAYWSPTAAAVGALAIRQFAAGRRDDVWSLVPRYSRRAAAEEKRDRDRAGGA
jgi:tRNA threonylcarbamoyladenosine biosynthesis protein TsaB